MQWFNATITKNPPTEDLMPSDSVAGSWMDLGAEQNFPFEFSKVSPDFKIP